MEEDELLLGSLDLDDDLFTLKKERKKLQQVDYTAKREEPLWFLETPISSHSSPQEKKALKSKLDHAFYCRNYEECLSICRSLIAQPWKSDNSFRKELIETSCRCLLALGQCDELVNTLRHQQLSREDLPPGKYDLLLSQALLQLGRHGDALPCLRAAITANSVVPALWIAVAECYATLQRHYYARVTLAKASQVLARDQQHTSYTGHLRQLLNRIQALETRLLQCPSGAERVPAEETEEEAVFITEWTLGNRTTDGQSAAAGEEEAEPEIDPTKL